MAARQNPAVQSNEPTPATLGDVLYARPAAPLVPEREWLELVLSVAVGSQTALQSLYERLQRPVFTLATRIVRDAAGAQEATLETFLDVWRHARGCEPASTTVIAWIMNIARARALARAASPSGAATLGDPEQPLLQPPGSLRRRLAERIAREARTIPIMPPPFSWSEPPWEEVSPGILCKLLATDAELHRVSMLVRLLPGIEYPPHTHAGLEELHLLQGELWIDARKLQPGEYNRAEAPTSDQRVWSETGCACVLVTSTRDRLH